MKKLFITTASYHITQIFTQPECEDQLMSN